MGILDSANTVKHAFRMPGVTYKIFNHEHVSGRQVYIGGEEQSEVHFASDEIDDDGLYAAVKKCCSANDIEVGVVDKDHLLKLEFNVYAKSSDPLFNSTPSSKEVLLYW